MMRLIFGFFILIWAATAQADVMKLAVTTSFHNSGLADILVPEIARNTGIELQLLVVGTGQALRLGRAGDVDAVLVHSRAAEEQFIRDGHGTHRREIMYNDFVLIGPEADPAGISGAGSAAVALAAIAAKQSVFVSRGDDSGTHRKELSLWESAGLIPEGAWYRAVGSGMGASLNTAAGMEAYILSDRASWLNFGNSDGLALLFAGDPVLFNQYAFVPVNPDKNGAIRHDLALKLEGWLVSDKARDLINGYRLAGEQLFTFNAR